MPGRQPTKPNPNPPPKISVQRLFRPKRLHRLHSGGSASGEGCGQQDRENDEGRGRRESKWIVDADSVELAAEQPREKYNRRERYHRGDGSNKSHLTQDRNHNAAARSPKGKANPDLACPLLCGVRKHAIEANGSQYESKDGETNGKDGEGSFPKGRELRLGFHGAQPAHYQSGVEVVNHFPDRGCARLGRLRSLNVELYANGMFHLCVSTIDGRPKFGSEVSVTSVANDSDDSGIGFGAGMVFGDEMADGV